MPDEGKATPRQSPSKSIPGKSIPQSRSVVGSQSQHDLAHSNPNITCKHLQNRKSFLRIYFDVIRNLSYTSTYLRMCEVCNASGVPIYACLQCIHFSCCKAGADHYTQHNTDTGHALSVDCTTGVLRCVVCRVFVWNADLERIYKIAKQGLVPKFLLGQGTTPSSGFEEELDDRVFTKHCVGVKGLYNLGNTCFMNSVLQPLMHIPDLVTYFLSYSGKAQHRRANCTENQAGKPCVACELDALCVRMFNGNKKPVCPSELLYAIWRGSSEMAGYEQQDAHEFFICLRNSLHKDIGGQQYNCSCVVHQLFAGVLQSDVTCPLCRAKTETYDPFLDISLDLMHHGDYMASIEDCLENFSKTESILMDSYTCPHCHQGVNDVLKRMTIRSAPKILVIHLKRFEHGSTRVKIDKHISFPLFLDMYKYSAEYQEDDSMTNFGLTEGDEALPYRLIGAISHVGSLDSGHYTSYVVYRDQWFFIDDALVDLATETDVLNSQAYMLFYSALSPVKAHI